MENLTQSQIRLCANESMVLVTMMLSYLLKGCAVTVKAQSSSHPLQALLGRPETPVLELNLVFTRFVFFTFWRGQGRFCKLRRDFRKSEGP